MVRLGYVRLGWAFNTVGRCGGSHTAGNCTVINWGGRVVRIPVSLVCSATCGGGSDYNLVPTLKTVPESNPGGGNIFLTVQTIPVAHSASRTMGTRSFPGVKSGRGFKLTPHSLLVAWSRNSRAIPVLPLRAVRPIESLSACTTRVHFTLLFTLPQRGTGTAVEQWLRCCAANRKVAGSIPADIIRFFIDIKSFP